MSRLQESNMGATLFLLALKIQQCLCSVKGRQVSGFLVQSVLAEKYTSVPWYAASTLGKVNTGDTAVWAKCRRLPQWNMCCLMKTTLPCLERPRPCPWLKDTLLSCKRGQFEIYKHSDLSINKESLSLNKYWVLALKHSKIAEPIKKGEQCDWPNNGQSTPYRKCINRSASTG